MMKYILSREAWSVHSARGSPAAALRHSAGVCAVFWCRFQIRSLFECRPGTMNPFSARRGLRVKPLGRGDRSDLGHYRAITNCMLSRTKTTHQRSGLRKRLFLRSAGVKGDYLGMNTVPG